MQHRYGGLALADIVHLQKNGIFMHGEGLDP